MRRAASAMRQWSECRPARFGRTRKRSLPPGRRETGAPTADEAAGARSLPEAEKAHSPAVKAQARVPGRRSRYLNRSEKLAGRALRSAVRGT